MGGVEPLVRMDLWQKLWAEEVRDVISRTDTTLMGGIDDETIIPIGTQVEKVSGYKWPGEVVAVFRTKQGKLRYVVECTAPEVAGALHIYSPKQIRRA